jgi:hypothetical protein
MKSFKNALIYITLFGMETCWLYAALNAANQSVGGVLYVPFLLVALFLSLGISALLKLLPWPKIVLTILSWIIWPAAFLLMVKYQLFALSGFSDSVWLSAIAHAFSQIFYTFEAPLLIFISTAVMWWLGRRMAYFKADFSTAVTETQLGVVILALVYFSAYQLKLEQSGSTGVALIFFFLALVGISLSHARGDSWLSSSHKKHWLGITLVLIGLILVFGLVASYIFTPDLIQVFINAAKWVWSLIERLIAFFASLFPPSTHTSPEMSPLPTMTSPDTETSGGIHWPEWLRPSLLLVWEILIVGLIIVAVWRVTSEIFHWLQRHAPSGGDEVESLKGGFWTDFLAFFKNLVYRLLKIQRKPREDDGLKNLPPQVVSVRQLYAQFLHWTSSKGHPREKFQTPEEYREALYRLMPEMEKNLDLITREYMNVRYGSGIPTDDKLVELKNCWHDLKKEGFKKTAK